MDALDFEAISEAQKEYPETLNLACSDDHSLDFKDFTNINHTTVVRPGMRLDVKRLVNTCIAGQQTKIHRHNPAPLQDFKLLDKRFQAMHLNLVGP